jgi:hypothetical protein
MLNFAILVLPLWATWGLAAPQNSPGQAAEADSSFEAVSSDAGTVASANSEAVTSIATTAEILALADRLAPPYVDEGPGPDAEAVGPLLDLLLALPDDSVNAKPTAADPATTNAAVLRISDADLTIAFERLAPNLEERHTDRIAAGLIAGALPNPDLAAQLLLAAPYSEARVALARFALNEQMPAQHRASAVGRILAADGRHGLETLRPLLHPESNAHVLRRIYFYWAGMATDDDLPFLEELVLQGPGMCREFALQTWARVETRPEKRLQIFRHSATSATSYRSVVVRMLARAGSSQDLEEHIKEMLSAPRPENRRLALDVLAYVAGDAAVLEEYRRTSSERDNLDQQGRWMTRLARLDLTEARQLAADWLQSTGWRHPRYSLAVAKSLAETDAMDALLGTFLHMEGPSADAKLVLASARLPHSVDAEDYLRQALTAAPPMHAIRICTVLGRNGHPMDLQVLFDLARSPAHPGMVRAAAIKQLAASAEATEYLPRLIRNAQLDFEAAEALVEGAIRHGDPALRKLAMDLCHLGKGAGFSSDLRALAVAGLNDEEIEGLRFAVWRTQAIAPNPADAKESIQRACNALKNADDPFADENWPDPRDMESEFTSLILLTQAAAATSPGKFHKQVPRVAQQAVPSAVFVCAQAALTSAPLTSLAMASALAGRTDLERLPRIRALGLVARAAQAAGETEAHLAALERMLAMLKRDRSESALLELAYGMAFSSPRGWLLPRDQIAQRRVLAYAEAQDPQGGRTAALRGLESGGCPTHTLIEAIELLLVADPEDPDYIFPSNAFLAEDLALKAVDMEPDNLQARHLLVEALIAEDSPEEAVAQLDEILRLASPGSALAVHAVQLKQQLLSELEEED